MLRKTSTKMLYLVYAYLLFQPPRCRSTSFDTSYEGAPTWSRRHLPTCSHPWQLCPRIHDLGTIVDVVLKPEEQSLSSSLKHGMTVSEGLGAV
ncbi:hypothetical protein BJ166DRAFT_538838, partial [Pestalotiopsis sp. NC0098]